NAAGQRDYESGFTVDMSAEPRTQFDRLNVEGHGFGGARNLLNSSKPLGTLHTIEVVADPQRKLVELFLDGKRCGERPFAPGPLHLDEVTVGARYYTNGPSPQQVRGFLHGDIAEILVFGRVLTATETKSVQQYLKRKYARLEEKLPGTLTLLGRSGERLALVP